MGVEKQVSGFGPLDLKLNGVSTIDDCQNKNVSESLKACMTYKQPCFYLPAVYMLLRLYIR